MKKTFYLTILFIFSIFFSFAKGINQTEIITAEIQTQKLEAAESYFVEYLNAINKTQKRLVLMNKKGALSKLGEETIEGLISGTLHYKTKIKGFGAVITITYSNYCDEEGWTFDGQIITKSNMAGNGTMEGVVCVEGIAAGKVYYEKAVLKGGKPGDGTYGIETDNFSRTEVPYTVFFKADDAITVEM